MEILHELTKQYKEPLQGHRMSFGQLEIVRNVVYGLRALRTHPVPSERRKRQASRLSGIQSLGKP